MEVVVSPRRPMNEDFHRQIERIVLSIWNLDDTRRVGKKRLLRERTVPKRGRQRCIYLYSHNFVFKLVSKYFNVIEDFSG